MSIVFLLALIVIIAIGLMTEYKQVKKLGFAAKWTYLGLFAITVGIVAAGLLHVEINLPTEFFVHTVSPFILKFIK